MLHEPRLSECGRSGTSCCCCNCFGATPHWPQTLKVAHLPSLPRSHPFSVFLPSSLSCNFCLTRVVQMQITRRRRKWRRRQSNSCWNQNLGLNLCLALIAHQAERQPDRHREIEREREGRREREGNTRQGRKMKAASVDFSWALWRLLLIWGEQNHVKQNFKRRRWRNKCAV